MTKETVRNTLDVALYAGQIMLESGAETYRVEETIERICGSKGLSSVNCFTIPTGIFLSCTFEDHDFSYVRRMKTNVIDLHIISMVNAFSRAYVSGEIPYEDAMSQLDKIRTAPHFAVPLQFFAGGIAGGFFTMIYGGSGLEALLAFITSFFVVMASYYIGSKTKAFFLKNLGGGMVNTILALLLVDLTGLYGLKADLNYIVIGSLMPLVPGVAITNALRDSISGDFVSGVSKLSEAFGIALAIALGVGSVLHIRLLLTGGIF